MARREVILNGISHLEGEWGYMVWSDNHENRFLEEIRFARKFVPLHSSNVVKPVLQVVCVVMREVFHHVYNVAFLKERFMMLREK